MKLFIALMLLATNAMAQSNPQLINWFVGADLVGTTGDTKADLESDFYMREFEFSAFSTIDQTFEGVLTLAYHHELEAGEDHMEVHEGFLYSSKLFDLATVKIGKFFLGFGRLNRFHRHDWAFIEAPMVQKAFFGNEGVKDTGVEYKRNLPGISSTITLGVTSGNEFNHTGESHDHAAGVVKKAKGPTGYLRYAKFFEYTPTRGMEVGLNYIQRKDQESAEFQYAGLDLVYKNRIGKLLKTLVQLEAWTRNQKHVEDGETEKHQDSGAYVYYENGIDQHHAWGLRLDYYNQDKRDDADAHDHGIDGLEVDGNLSAASLAYIYTNSEFMKTRVTLEHGQGIHIEDDEDTDTYTRGMLQFVFSIGAHPAHVY